MGIKARESGLLGLGLTLNVGACYLAPDFHR